MSKVAPFRALTYNQEKIKSLADVVCPPYDIISPRQQDALLERHPQNYIHVLLRKDAPGEDKYQKAGEIFRQWRKEGILERQAEPALYFYSHEYWIKREKKVRFGFIALLRLEEKKSSVFGHEHTHTEPKEDRLRLLRQVKANLSPIFVVFADKKRLVPFLWDKHVKSKKPFIEVADDERSMHRLWKITDPVVLKKISDQMEQENMFIADGHHRYEVASTYRNEMKEHLEKIEGEEPFNYIMAYFTNIDPSGLTILPIHRLVKMPARPDMNAIVAQLNEHFFVEEIKDRTRFFFLLEKAGRSEHVIGMYNHKRHWLLRLKNVKVLDKMITDKPPEYRSLDVSILNSLVLRRILDLDVTEKGNVAFIPEKDELLTKADTDSSFIAFFLNPTKMEQIVAVALKGEKMPPKSTYFYPKVISGLVINPHED
ncbi:MAG TPA: DUF1015 domain-containing protein [Candidatus Omnitrophota bacterium]|nr:DUF1015 domain-containing protein [Candidatus Omnitrophota bacterium]HRZ15573.1 DUF1015 domain-containing protein [Candidatus Omnitrophota bacterium]